MKNLRHPKAVSTADQESVICRFRAEFTENKNTRLERHLKIRQHLPKTSEPLQHRNKNWLDLRECIYIKAVIGYFPAVLFLVLDAEGSESLCSRKWFLGIYTAVLHLFGLKKRVMIFHVYCDVFI